MTYDIDDTIPKAIVEDWRHVWIVYWTAERDHALRVRRHADSGSSYARHIDNRIAIISRIIDMLDALGHTLETDVAEVPDSATPSTEGDPWDEPLPV